MTFRVFYIGEPAWHLDYTELNTIEIFFKKYFEEMLDEGETVREVGPHIFHIIS